MMENNENISDETGSSSSEVEDESAFELTDQVEKNFFKTLNCLKRKDPQIYDKETRFFGLKPELDEEYVKQRRTKIEAPLNVRAYERNLLLQNTIIPDDEDTSSFKKPVTYVEEQKQLKDSFKKVLNDTLSDESDGEIGGLFHESKKSKKEKEKEEADYKKWLKGNKKEIEDKTTEGDLKFLHDYWNDPKLDEGEKFLRDYILNKRFLDDDNNEKQTLPDGSIPSTDTVTLEEDEQALTEQTQFEHKFNFRFEEPDREFIKRYPRIMENSMRRRDDRRKLKREAIRERKKMEKEKKKQKLKKLQDLKFQEIKEKISKLKDITGNPELGFQDEEIEKDFDPNEHDLKMQKMFSDEFYNQEETEKPVFDDDLDLENYDNDGAYYDETEPHCEDPEFNMDCDFTPDKLLLKKKLKAETRKKKKKAKQNSGQDPDVKEDLNIAGELDENIKKEVDEYYGLDCEDFIGETPCRFRYRQVVPNSFGLTIDEILAADDKELDKWCSINKIAQIRPENVELYDVKAYEQKAKNEELKRKILPSLFKRNEKRKKKKNKKRKLDVADSSKEENIINESAENSVTFPERNLEMEKDIINNGTTEESVSRMKRKKVDGKEDPVKDDLNSLQLSSNRNSKVPKKNKLFKNKKLEKINNKSRQKFKRKNENKPEKQRGEEKAKFYCDISDLRLKAYGIKPKQFKNKLKYGKSNG